MPIFVGVVGYFRSHAPTDYRYRAIRNPGLTENVRRLAYFEQLCLPVNPLGAEGSRSKNPQTSFD